jgi:hypothetical protein
MTGVRASIWQIHVNGNPALMYVCDVTDHTSVHCELYASFGTV